MSILKEVNSYWDACWTALFYGFILVMMLFLLKCGVTNYCPLDECDHNNDCTDKVKGHGVCHDANVFGGSYCSWEQVDQPEQPGNTKEILAPGV
ncbi:MAG TPA: hypothetical protein QF353_01170 [Gammaproteobacteria bacterium]|nr:hypothetical protein [Gammaproteobacteria bacterium]